ncbi:hypothetical protein G3I44_08330 [Halogeometricum borinquense]|uniref:Uncharacterized protein n=1 Tax=Halogeometricum borinquense TaxID=60847 RepID=A0A6C0UGF7_9EURY|nr:hypothetical protein [Halogeometricum borinquense]QIB74287.1 hypothetical protein G3I44_08330 [Halogeometricum borinquense]
MCSEFSLVVPEEEATLETGKQFSRYHAESSNYDGSIEEISAFERFENRLRQKGRFRIAEKPTKVVIEAGEPSMADTVLEYADKNGVIYDPEGLDLFVKSLEDSREQLRGELSDDRMEIMERTIERCINLIEYAKENGYGISF